MPTPQPYQSTRIRSPKPLWDGMAAAQGRLYYCTPDGQLLCAGDPNDIGCAAARKRR